MMRTTQESAPWGGPVAFCFFPRAGLNFAINSMVASVHETTRRNGAAGRLRCLL
jgi:hypothetical protein